jgi:hypothetical protein
MSAPAAPASSASLSRWLGPLVFGLFVAGFVVNNLGPYLGSQHLAAFTMYSGLAPNGDNHLFIHDVRLFDAGTYVRLLEVRPLGADTRPATEFARFARLQNERGRLVHLNMVRYHASRICAADPSAGLRLKLRTERGEQQTIPNVCAQPAMLRYALVTHYPPCQPVCRAHLRLWISGGLWDD